MKIVKTRVVTVTGNRADPHIVRELLAVAGLLISYYMGTTVQE